MKFVYLPISRRKIKLDGEPRSRHLTPRKLKFLSLKFIGSQPGHQVVRRNYVWYEKFKVKRLETSINHELRISARSLATI